MVIPVVTYFIKKARINYPFICLLGKASYNIFLTQMTYYIFSDRILAYLNLIRPYQLLFNVILCVFIGLIFYFVELFITKISIVKFNKTM